MGKFKSIDLFAGIGGIRLGFDRAFGEDIETVFVSEWDEFAQKTYRANFDDSFGIAGDITRIAEDSIPSFDICLAGFPCQAFSMAGSKQGFNDNYKGMCRGTLFQDVARICEYHKPKVIFCENVKGLVIHDKGRTFKIICKTFEELGYKVFHQVLNSKDYGVPQNRERVYIVAFREDIAPSKFKFPAPTDDTKRIRDILEEEAVSQKYYLSDVYVDTLKRHKARHEAKGNGFGYEIRDWDSVAGAIVCGGMGRERNLIIDKRQTDLTPITHIKGEINREGIRKMTPREWARLQGFPDSFKLPLADVHLYKQFGNSVTVNVIEAIANQIKEVLTMSIAGMKLNKGEWAEFYVMLKLLGEGRLYTANQLLQKNYESYLDVLKVIRQELSNQVLEYIIDDEHGVVTIKAQDSEDILASVPIEEFSQNAKVLFDDIKQAKGSAVPAPNSVCEFAKVIYVNKPKAPAVKALKKQFGGKNDIFVVVRDGQTAIVSVMGFSIKSKFGSNPTLFNAGSSSQFLYRLNGCDDNTMAEFNDISENDGRAWSKCREFLSTKGISMQFAKTQNPIYHDNLFLIRESMDRIMAWCVKDRLIDSTAQYEVKETVERMAQTNPLGVPNPTIYYEKAIKDFLIAGFTGMTAGQKWDGKEQVNGGYIVVMDDGDVLCYHSNDRESFRDYLFKNTHFEYVSADKYAWSRIFKVDDEYYLPLNVSVRFNTHTR